MKDAFVVIELGGVQHIVSEGDELTVNHLEGKVGDKIDINDVFLFQGADKTEIGAPTVPYSVKAEIVDQFKGKKIHVRTYKAKARTRRKVGHRQLLTKVRITKITAAASKAAKSTAAKTPAKPKASAKPKTSSKKTTKTSKK